jgi:hypothetical protein
MKRFSFRFLSQARVITAFVLAAAVAGACSEVTAPNTAEQEIVAGPGGDFAATDVSPPTVAILAPVNGATGVSTTARVVIQFSELMNLSTINSSTFTLSPQGGSPVAGVIMFHGSNRASFDVSSPMTTGTTYVVRVTSGAQDVSGNGVSPELTSTFTTSGTPPDVTSPTVTNVAPLNSATGVAVDSDIVVTFSEAMNATTINTASVTLTPTSGGSPVAAVVSYSSGPRTATLNPSSSLATSTSYTVNVTTAAKDLAGNSVTAFSSAFTTAAPVVDGTAPTVTNVSPTNGVTGVAVNADVIVTFSEPMNSGSISTSTFTLAPTSGGSPVPAVVSYNAGAGTATLNPSSSLAAGTSYTVNVTAGATDVAGNPLTAFTSSFTTSAAVGDVTPPTVSILAPANGATGVSTTVRVVIQFSELMNLSTINNSTFTLSQQGGSPLPGFIDFHGSNMVSFDVTSPMVAGTNYVVRVTSGAQDVAGNGVSPEFSSSFTTAGTAPDVTPPTVTNVSPVSGATGVAVGSDVVVTFSEAMNATTINAATVTLTPTSGGSAVAAVVSYSSGPRTATINPSASLTSSTSYTVSVTTGAKDLAGNSVTAFSSAFTTAAPAADVTPPTVTNVSPTNAATGVAVSSDIVVTFSEPMNGATVTTSSFTLTPTSGGSPVAAVVSYNSGAGTATLNPSANLAFSTSYTVNVTSGATDVAGNALTGFSSSFTTSAPTGDVTPPTVSIVAPANGATGVSTTLRVVIQFSEPMNLSTINNTTFTLSPQGGSPVPGFIDFHGSNIVSFDVSSPMITGTTYVVRVSSGAKDVAGNGVSPELTSSFTTAGTPPDVTAPTVTSVSPANAATGVAVGSDVVVTFSEAMNAGTITGSTFTLTPTSGGSPVAAVVSYSAGTATLNPSASLASSTSYTVNVTTGAKDAAGNSLTAFSSTFTTGDATAPTITAVSPTNNATGVGTNADVVVTFSETMNGGTITTSTFTLSPTSGGSPVAAVVSYDSGAGTATLNPSAGLAFSTSYTVNLSSGATDAAGNGLVPFASSFTTAAAPDVTSPTVTNVSPVNGATGVAVAADVVVTFSEPMNAATITASTVTLTPTSGGSPVAAVVSYSAGPRTATLNPSSNLAFSTGYTVNVTNGAADVAGNAVTPFSSSFTTGAAPDVTSPTVTNVSPANSSTGVALGADVVVTFSEPMNGASVTTSTFTLTPTAGGSPVAAVVSYNAGAGTATLNPSSNLGSSTSYTVNVTSGATDVTGNALTPFSSTFTTADVTAPTVISVSPLNNATGVAVGADVVVTFSEPMNSGTIGTSSFTLTPTSGGSPVAAVVSYNSGTATLNPTSSLASSTSYTVNLTSAATDVAGNALIAFSSAFTTADVISPTVTAVSPLNSATGVAVNADVVVTFSEPMNAATVTTSTVTLTPTSGGSPVTAVVSYSAGPRTATLNPSVNLATSTSYTVNATSGATDVAGNSLTPFSSSFTTAAPDVTAPTIVSVTPANRSVNIATNAQVRVTFNEPIDPATITSSTFQVVPWEAGVLKTPLSGTRTYDAATNTMIFQPSSVYLNHSSYHVKVNTGLKDIAGNSVSAATTTCFSPAAGAGDAMSMNGIWAGNNACEEVHWHLVLVQTGDQLSLGDCTSAPINCLTSAVSEAGRTILGGSACTPTTLGPPRICDVRTVSLTGTVTGASVNFTITMENGLTFTFNGTRSATGLNGNPFFTGVMSGATLTPVGMNLQREGL